MRSDLLNHSDRRRPDIEITAAELSSIWWRSSFEAVNAHVQGHRSTVPQLHLQDWWKLAFPHDMPSKYLGGTGHTKLIYEVQARNEEEHSPPGVQQAHWHLQGCLLTPHWRKINTHKTLFSTGYFHPTTALCTFEKLLVPSVKTLLCIWGKSVQICISNAA